MPVGAGGRTIGDVMIHYGHWLGRSLLMIYHRWVLLMLEYPAGRQLMEE